MINRAAVIVKLGEPFVDWINSVDPNDERSLLSIEEANQDRTVYLIGDDQAEDLEGWLAANFEKIFTSELGDWCMDEALWPKNRNLNTFLAWCVIECHTVIVDTLGSEITDDGF